MVAGVAVLLTITAWPVACCPWVRARGASSRSTYTSAPSGTESGTVSTRIPSARSRRASATASPRFERPSLTTTMWRRLSSGRREPPSRSAAARSVNCGFGWLWNSPNCGALLMLTSTWGSRPKLSTPARSSPCRCCRMRRTVVASLSRALCTLAERSAATSSDWLLGEVCTWKPARDAVSRVRTPSERRARPRDNGGGKTRQAATITASATTPAPKNRGRVISKPTVKGQPLGGDDPQRGQRDPRPDFQLPRMGCLDGGGTRRR